MPQFPVAAIQMEELAKNLLNEITGINPDLFGSDRGRQDSGVVIRLRQQQGATLLKPVFKAYIRMDKGVFERLIAIITAHMPDEQILQILGETERYVIKDGIIFDKKSIGEDGVPRLYANLRDLRGLAYNVSAEPAPGNKTAKMLELSVYLEMQKAGFPVDPIAIIEKLEITATAKQRWIEFIANQQKAQADAANKQFQLEMAKIQSRVQTETQKTQTDAAIKGKKIQEQKIKDEGKREDGDKRLGLENKRIELDYIARTGQTEASKEKTHLDHSRTVRENQDKARGNEG